MRKPGKAHESPTPMFHSRHMLTAALFRPLYTTVRIQVTPAKQYTSQRNSNSMNDTNLIILRVF